MILLIFCKMFRFCHTLHSYFLETAFGDSDAEDINQNNAGTRGDYKELAVLPDKIARNLYEYHVDDYAHGLPPLPEDRNDTNVTIPGFSSLIRWYMYADTLFNNILTT